MRKNTMIELVTELEKLSDSEGKAKMIKLAKDGMFHDFRSKSACGKTYFVECTVWCKSHMIESDCKLIDRLKDEIINGDYDEEMTEECKVIVKNDLNNDPTISEKDKEFFIKAMGL